MNVRIPLSVTMRAALLLGAGLFSGLLVVAVAQADVANQKGKPKIVSKAALVNDLTASGFQVSEGRPTLYTIDDCIAHTYCKQREPARQVLRALLHEEMHRSG